MFESPAALPQFQLLLELGLPRLAKRTRAHSSIVLQVAVREELFGSAELDQSARVQHHLQSERQQGVIHCQIFVAHNFVRVHDSLQAVGNGDNSDIVAQVGADGLLNGSIRLIVCISDRSVRLDDNR